MCRTACWRWGFFACSPDAPANAAAQNVLVPKGTYYVPRADQDPAAKDYAIRGSLDRYLCSKQNKGVMIGNELQFNNIGKNCTVWHETNATGDCYRTTFGDWKCYMHGEGPQVADRPPPKG